MVLDQIFGSAIVDFPAMLILADFVDSHMPICKWNANCVEKSAVTKLVARTAPFGPVELDSSNLSFSITG